jgi:hypothetical protein
VARVVFRVALAFTLMGLGWAGAKAQTSSPDFELVVDAPVGETSIECRRGCSLLWVERGIPDGAIRQQTFSFSCGGGGVQRCSSSRVGGWVRP